MRFRYHFDGKRQTNRLDKPEWYFTHVLNLMHEHKPFMTTHIQPLLEKGGYGDVNASVSPECFAPTVTAHLNYPPGRILPCPAEPANSETQTHGPASIDHPCDIGAHCIPDPHFRRVGEGWGIRDQADVGRQAAVATR